MGFWKNLFARGKKESFEEDEFWLEEDDIVINMPQMGNEKDRSVYVHSKLEQINDAQKQLDQLTIEYNLVTSYLTDMEEIESLPEEEQENIRNCAMRITQLDTERKQYHERKNKLSEMQFQMARRMQEELREGYEKINYSEEYQEKIKRDLKRVEGEKQAYLYRKDELISWIGNTRGMIFICIGAVAACLLMLLILHFGFEMNVQFGYLFTVLAAALVITFLFVKNLDFKKELAILEISINKIILLQNKVKIRYVNNTNLLDYYYAKFNVSKAAELASIYEKYQSEKKVRERYEIAKDELEESSYDLLKILGKYQIQDKEIWLHQVDALLDPREMVEIRHSLISRRQKLRKQMEHKKEMGSTAQQEIKDLVRDYPQFADEILTMVSDYERRTTY